MEAAIQFPYFRGVTELPAPLPTMDETHASTDILKGDEPWADRKVVGLGQYFIVKYGRYRDRLEGYNLLFIERNLRIAAPKLYAMWEGQDGQLYFVMERLEGDALDKLWSSLAKTDKDIIMAQVRAVFDQLRPVPSPGYSGSINKSCMPHHLFYEPGYPAHVSGPFRNEEEVVMGLIHSSRSNAKLNGKRPYLADFFEDQFLHSLTRKTRPSMFTHSDLQRKNILVHKVHLRDGQRSSFKVSIVDWETAGWYPCWWEYVAAFFAFRWEDDWPKRVAEAVDAWPAEAALMRMIYQDLFF